MFGIDSSSRTSLRVGIVLAISCAQVVIGSESPSWAVPRNILVDPGLTNIVAGMLEASPTFRDQCRRLDRLPRVRVRLLLDVAGGSERSGCRAQCVLSRYEFGHIDAAVHLWSVENAPELIAHELEHVLEYAEGTNYRMLSVRRASGVWVTGHGHFESARAIDVQERVAREVARNRPALSSPRRATSHDRERP
jgi:hypothetical protein